MNVGRAVWPRFSESVFVAAQCKQMFEKVISCISIMWCSGWSLSTATVTWMTSASADREIQTVCGFTLDPNTSSNDKFPYRVTRMHFCRKLLRNQHPTLPEKSWSHGRSHCGPGSESVSSCKAHQTALFVPSGVNRLTRAGPFYIPQRSHAPWWLLEQL